MKIVTPAWRQEALELANQLVTIKAALGRLGLFKTMHALDEATKAIGFEIEEKVTQS